MTVVIGKLLSDAVTVPLPSLGGDVTVTLRRLNAVDFADCIGRARALLGDKEALVEIIHRNGLASTGAAMRRALVDPAFQMGLGEWLGRVECGILAISGWTGVKDETGALAPLAADPTKIAGVAASGALEPQDLRARLTMEQLFLAPHFSGPVSAEIDKAARILVTEGELSGVSENGTAAAAPMPEAPTGAATAPKPASPAPPAAATAPDAAVPK